MKKILKFAISLGLIVAMLFSVGCDFVASNGGYVNPSTTTFNSSAELIDTVDIKTVNASDRQILSKADVYEKYSQSVVVIETNLGVGSGVIVDIDSENYDETTGTFYIVTCNHVIDGATSAKVYVPDATGKNYSDTGYDRNYVFSGVLGGTVNVNSPVRLIGGDTRSDIAVLGLFVADQTIALDIRANVANVMSKQNKLRVGDDVVAIGNPKGSLPGTLLSGVVSYINRQGNFSGIGTLSLIQTDAGITHGNSGGALFNLYGELVGITNGGVVDMVLGTDGNPIDLPTSYNYAIPLYVSDTETEQGIVPVASQLIATSTATNYGYITGRWKLGFSVNNNLEITSIESYSASATAGLEVGDRLLSINYNQSVFPVSLSNISDLDSAMTQMKQVLKLGDRISLTVLRKGAVVSKTLIITQYIYRNTGK